MRRCSVAAAAVIAVSHVGPHLAARVGPIGAGQAAAQIKLHDVGPDAMPAGMASTVTISFSNSSLLRLTGFVQPGCTLLSLEGLQVELIAPIIITAPTAAVVISRPLLSRTLARGWRRPQLGGVALARAWEITAAAIVSARIESPTHPVGLGFRV